MASWTLAENLRVGPCTVNAMWVNYTANRSKTFATKNFSIVSQTVGRGMPQKPCLHDLRIRV